MIRGNATLMMVEDSDMERVPTMAVTVTSHRYRSPWRDNIWSISVLKRGP